MQEIEEKKIKNVAKFNSECGANIEKNINKSLSSTEYGKKYDKIAGDVTKGKDEAAKAKAAKEIAGLPKKEKIDFTKDKLLQFVGHKKARDAYTEEDAKNNLYGLETKKYSKDMSGDREKAVDKMEAEVIEAKEKQINTEKEQVVRAKVARDRKKKEITDSEEEKVTINGEEKKTKEWLEALNKGDFTACTKDDGSINATECDKLVKVMDDQAKKLGDQ